MMIALGYYFMKRENGAEDFFKGGGRIPWWAAGISIYATMLSAITYMAYPAKTFATKLDILPHACNDSNCFVPSHSLLSTFFP